MVLPPESIERDLREGQVGWIAQGSRLYKGPNNDGGDEFVTNEPVPVMDVREPQSGWLPVVVDLGRGKVATLFIVIAE